MLKPFVKIEGADAVKGVRVQDLLGYWELESGDTAQPLVVPRYSDKSIQIFAVTDWNGATVTLQQTNDPDLTKYYTAKDTYDTSITQTADGDKCWALGPNCLAIKPVIIGGDAGTKVRVCIVGNGAKE